MVIAEDSPLRRPPSSFSRRQIVVLDGLRFAAEMADVAYQRLSNTLQAIAPREERPSVRVIATAMLDAWSIVDSANRFRDLLSGLPGLPNLPWKRLLHDRTQDVAVLRDCVQHQLGEVQQLIAGGGQLWGYLSWAELQDNQYTGTWRVMAAGSTYVGDEYLFIGPMSLPFKLPPGRVRLNAFGQQVYLGRTLLAVRESIAHLEISIRDGVARPLGEPATFRRGSDYVGEGHIEVLCSYDEDSPIVANDPSA